MGLKSRIQYANLRAQNLNPSLQFKKTLGTGDALKSAIPFLKINKPTLILFGDVPLVSNQSLKRFAKILKKLSSQNHNNKNKETKRLWKNYKKQPQGNLINQKKLTLLQKRRE